MVKNNITIRNAQIIFRNFAGRPGRYNAEGIRSFSVVIDDPEFADHLKADGWNVKGGGVDDEGNERNPYLPVAVSFDPYPPRIMQFQDGGGEVIINADNAFMLDDAEIEYCDMVIRPYNWKRDDGSYGGVKAYLKDLKVVTRRDIFCD